MRGKQERPAGELAKLKESNETREGHGMLGGAGAPVGLWVLVVTMLGTVDFGFGSGLDASLAAVGLKEGPFKDAGQMVYRFNAVGWLVWCFVGGLALLILQKVFRRVGSGYWMAVVIFIPMVMALLGGDPEVLGDLIGPALGLALIMGLAFSEWLNRRRMR